MCIVLPDVSAPLKVHSKIAPPPSSNPGHAEDPNISTQKSSSQCSASHESLAIEGGPPDAKSAVTCSIDHDQHFADFLAVFFQDSQGLPSYAKGASRNLDPAILDPLETQQGKPSTLSSFLFASSPCTEHSLHYMQDQGLYLQL